jgi:hypothetical protein
LLSDMKRQHPSGGITAPSCSLLLTLLAVVTAIRFFLVNILLSPTSVDSSDSAYTPLDVKHTTRSHPKRSLDEEVCLSCQQLSDRFGIAHLSTWGESDWLQRACWADQKCNTVPEALKLLPPVVFEDTVDRDARNYYLKLAAFIKDEPLPERPHLLIAIPTVTRKTSGSSGKLLRMIRQVLRQIMQLPAADAAGVKVIVINNSPAKSNLEFETLRKGLSASMNHSGDTSSSPGDTLSMHRPIRGSRLARRFASMEASVVSTVQSAPYATRRSPLPVLPSPSISLLSHTHPHPTPPHSAATGAIRNTQRLGAGELDTQLNRSRTLSLPQSNTTLIPPIQHHSHCPNPTPLLLPQSKQSMGQGRGGKTRTESEQNIWEEEEEVSE